MKWILLLCMVCLNFSGCGSENKELSPENFYGTWEIDFDRSLMEIQKSPKYNEKTALQFPNIIKKYIKTMKLKITDSDFIYLVSNKENKTPYEFMSSTDESISLSMKIGSKETSVTLTLLNGNYMAYKSAATDDMDYYVWKKVN